MPVRVCVCAQISSDWAWFGGDERWWMLTLGFGFACIPILLALRTRHCLSSLISRLSSVVVAPHC